jgi:hypothetical protein
MNLNLEHITIEVIKNKPNLNNDVMMPSVNTITLSNNFVNTIWTHNTSWINPAVTTEGIDETEEEQENEIPNLSGLTDKELERLILENRRTMLVLNRERQIRRRTHLEELRNQKRRNLKNKLTEDEEIEEGLEEGWK